MGYIHNSKVDYERSPESKHTVNTPFNVDKLDSLPKVGIVYAYSNAPIEPLNSLLDAGYQGIVSAGVGNGNVNAAHLERLEKPRKMALLLYVHLVYQRVTQRVMLKWMILNMVL